MRTPCSENFGWDYFVVAVLNSFWIYRVFALYLDWLNNSFLQALINLCRKCGNDLSDTAYITKFCTEMQPEDCFGLFCLLSKIHIIFLMPSYCFNFLQWEYSCFSKKYLIGIKKYPQQMRSLWSEDIQILQKEENYFWGEEKSHFSSQAITERKHTVNIRTIYPVSIALTSSQLFVYNSKFNL